MPESPLMPPNFRRSIHLLYVPTLCCNLDCAYCYLGEQTTHAALKVDAGRAVATLRHALGALREAGVLAFNVSLHGGEVTTLPEAVLDELLTLIRRHYSDNFDAINALGHKKSAPHIKTNLYKFAPFYELFDKHKVSISASIDLPLALHGRYRTTRGGRDWLEKTHENIRLLARYPHAKKISATLCSEHLADIPAIIKDIRFIHDELGFDMNQFNIMFAFDSAMNRASKGDAVLTPATPAQQLALYAALKAEFTGTDLEDGLRRNWFDEFKPSYCTNAFNCGERFYLLQSDGSVYSCVRGQGIEEFHYGNVFTDRIDDILANGARKIERIHQAHGFDDNCQRCEHLSLCHTGCPVVKHQNSSASKKHQQPLLPFHTPLGGLRAGELWSEPTHVASPTTGPLPPLQGEGWGGDGGITTVLQQQCGQFGPIPLPASPLKGEERVALPNDHVSLKTSGRSYTCELQKFIYADNPRSFPASSPEQQREDVRQYRLDMHPTLAFAQDASAPVAGIRLPNDLAEDKNTLHALIAADPILQELYSDSAFLLEVGDELIPLRSQLLKDKSTWHTLVPGDRIILHARRSLFDANCPEFLRNTLYLQMLRDTPVVYGDEQRVKQEHVFTYQLFANCLKQSTKLGADYLMAELSGLIELHREHYRRGVRNNLFFSTLFLREYHYQKQKSNAFYHIQAINLPFQNFEFNYPTTTIEPGDAP